MRVRKAAQLLGVREDDGEQTIRAAYRRYSAPKTRKFVARARGARGRVGASAAHRHARARRRLAIKWHPDKCKDARFRRFPQSPPSAGRPPTLKRSPTRP